MKRQSGMSQADAGQTHLDQTRLTRSGRRISQWLSSLVIAGWMVVLAAPCQAQEIDPEPETPAFACAVAPVYPATEETICETSVNQSMEPCCDCTHTEAPGSSTCDPYEPPQPPGPLVNNPATPSCPSTGGGGGGGNDDCGKKTDVKGNQTPDFCGNPLTRALSMPVITDAVMEDQATTTVSCSSCPVSKTDVLQYSNFAPPIAVNRYLMPSNQVDAFAFGRGMASDFDFRVTFYPNTTAGDTALLIDPQLGRVQYLTDANNDGTYELEDDIYYNSIVLTQANGTPIANPVMAQVEPLYVTVTRGNGIQYKLEVMPVPIAGSGQTAVFTSRLISKSNAQGRAVSYTYKTFSQNAIENDPTLQWQLDTMTDLYGNTAEFTYHNSQIGGRWVVSEIDFNSGDIVLEYDYNNSGFLETVERNEEVKSTYSYDIDTFYDAATLTWHERMRTGHDANDTLLLSVDYQSGDGTVVNQFANILKGRKNGLGQVKSMIYPDNQESGRFVVLEGDRYTEVKAGQSVRNYIDYFSDPPVMEDDYFRSPSITLEQTKRAQPPVSIDETGYQITNTYDSAGNLIRKTYPDTSYEKWIYNGISQVTYYRDRAGFVTVTEYNNAFQPVRVIRGMTDPSGTGSPTATSEAVQDIFGYYGTSHANEGQLAWSATTAYSGGSFSAPSTDLRTDYTYNANQRLIKVQTPTPHRGSISLPSGFAARPQIEYGWTGGLKTSETNQLGHTTYFSYDELGRLVETLYSDSTKEQVYYDDVNRKVYRRDRTGRVSLSVYGPSGRLSMQYDTYGTDADLSDGTVSQINSLADSQYTSYGYGVGDSRPVLINRGGAVTMIALDYRGRPVEQHQHVRSDDFTLTTLTNYVGNQRFYTTNKVGSHEVRTYYGYSADRQTVRTIQTRKPGVTFGNNAAILSATRQTGADPDYIINDAVRDIRGQIVQLVDPLGIESLTTYDALGRSLIHARSKGSLELVSESVYDHLGNVIETTSEIGLVTEMEYDPAGNLKVRTVAPGTSDELEWSYCYDLDGHLLTETAPGGAVTTHVRETCCSLTEGIKNALGHGTIVNKDSAGRTVHTATVKDFDEHTNLLNPLDGKTLSEQTTRYGVDGRVQYQTHWKVPLGAINRNDPPIAGLNSVPVADGLTTQYVYFQGITNEQQVEYSKTVNLLGGGTEDVSIDAALAKLYSSIASGGVNWEFGDSSCGSATVVIAPDEKTMQVSISDAAGRAVMQATMTGPTATTPNQLVNWSCTRYDDIDTATNAIHTLKTSQIDPDGKVVASFTDGLGRTIAVVDQLGKKSTSQFDSGGNLLKSINALSKETVYTYDGLGRQLTVKDPLNNTLTTVYDSDTGQVTQRKDAKNVSTWFAYDDLGRNTTTTDRLGKVTTRTYDSAGRLGTIVDAQSKTTTYSYDLLGQRTSVTFPDTSSKTFEFDAAGRVTKVTLESGITQKTIYEFSGVVDKIEYRDDSNTLTGTDDFTYNGLLQRTAATSRYSVVNGWTYDDLGRTLTESTTYSGKTYTVGYDYDSWGRLEEITYPSGRKAEYTFDERGAIDLIKWDSTQIENRGYNDIGLLTSVDRPGVDETRGYDDAGRLTSIGNSNVGTATYTYDANHNKLSESWSGAMAAWSFTTENGGTYPSGYDAEDRFRNFIQSGQSKSLYLDRSDIGNITNHQMNSNNSYRTYNNVHALTNVGGTGQTFDDDGNLTASYHGHTLGWDEAGMLKQVVVPSSPTVGIEGTNEYGYDATQRRVFKKITRSSTIAEHVVSIYAGPNLIAEYDAGTVAGSPSQEYVYAQEIDSLVLLVRSGGSQKLTITRNQQWSVTALADLSTGTVLERYTYDALGKRTILAADGSTVRNTSSYNMPFGYTSRQHDPETGLMYFRARYYDPSTSEFISQDPLEYVDGMSQYRAYFVPSHVDPDGKLAIPAACVTLCIGSYFCSKPIYDACKFRCDWDVCIKEVWDATPWYGRLVCGAATIGCVACAIRGAKEVINRCRPQPPPRPPQPPPQPPQPPPQPPKPPCPEWDPCYLTCTAHKAACHLSGLADKPDVPGGILWGARCVSCYGRCLGNCRANVKGNDMHWPWPSRGPAVGDFKWSRCDYWNWPGGIVP